MQKKAISIGKLKSLVSEARKSKAISRGTESWLLDIGVLPFVKKKKGIQEGLARYHESLRKADVGLGTRLSRIPLLGRMFRAEEKLTLGSKDIGKGGVSKIEEVARIPTYRATKPLKAVQHLSVPILALFGLEAIKKSKRQREEIERQRQINNELYNKMACDRKEEEYMGQIKMSEARGILKKAACEIKKLSSQNEWLVKNLASYMQREHAEKVATIFSERGWFDAKDIPRYRDKFASMSNLDTLEAAASVLNPPPQTVPLSDDDELRKTSGVSDEDPVIAHLLSKLT